jgi:zinc protease
MYDYSKQFFQKYYRPDNVVLIVTGDFDPAKTLEQIRAAYGGWKPGYVAPSVQPEPEQKGMRSVDVSYDGRTLPIVTLAWKGAGFDAKSREMAAAMLLGDLAFGETSEVYRELVLEKRLAQRVSSNFSPNRDPGLWSVFAMVSKEENMDAVRTALEAAVKRYQDTPPDAKRLDDLKKRARYELLMGLDTPDHVAGGVAPFVALSGTLESIDEIYAAMEQVTPADVQAAARKFLQNDRLTVATLKGVKS